MSRPVKVPFGFLAPKLLLFLAFTLGPLISVFILSLYNWNLLGGHKFIGLANYSEMLRDDEFWQATKNTFVFALMVVPVTLFAGLGLAILLNKPQPGRVFFRTVLFLPYAIPAVAVAAIAAWMFNDHYGVLNAILVSIGFPRLFWLSSPHLALFAVAIASVWMRVGFCMVVYLAALQDVPVDLYEAARLDGAGTLQQFRFVTWPMMKPVTIFLVITNFIYTFNIFDLIYVMTGGGPAFSTTILVQYLYDAGFDLQRQGYAATISVALYLLISLLTLLFWLTTRKREAHG